MTDDPATLHSHITALETELTQARPLVASAKRLRCELLTDPLRTNIREAKAAVATLIDHLKDAQSCCGELPRLELQIQMLLLGHCGPLEHEMEELTEACP